MEQQHRIAAITRAGDLDRLQRAASQITPGACSIGLAIRELARQGYLFPALVLLRPLVERVGVLAYLVEHPEAVTIWERGWKPHERPGLAKLLAAMRAVDPEESGLKEATLVAGRYHELIHGSPDASMETLVELPDGFAGFSVSKDFCSPARADAAAFEAALYLIVLIATMQRLFPAIEEHGQVADCSIAGEPLQSSKR